MPTPDSTTPLGWTPRHNPAAGILSTVYTVEVDDAHGSGIVKRSYRIARDTLGREGWRLDRWSMTGWEALTPDVYPIPKAAALALVQYRETNGLSRDLWAASVSA